MSYYHFFHITSKIRDDVYFQDILNNFQLFSWSKDRYFEWCSRTFIELVMVIFAHADYIIWKIADILILLLLVYA